MMDAMEHPFQPGTRVAITSRFASGVSEAFVEKVHKSGRFTLRGDTRQQYRPSRVSGFGDKGPTWWAHATGDSWSRSSLRLWTPEIDAELSAALAETRRRNRIREIRAKIERLKPDDITEAQLDQIEVALS